MQQWHKLSLDGIAASVTVAVLAKFLPPIAAGFTILWTGIQIIDWAIKKWKTWE